MIRRILTTILFVVVFQSIVAQMSLREAIDLAIDNNNELQMAKADVEIAKYNLRDIRGQLFPSINLNASYRLSQNELPKALLAPAFSISDALDEPTDNEGILGGALDGFVSRMMPDRRQEEANLAAQISLSQPLFLGGRLINGIRVLDRIKTLQEQRYELALQNTVMTVIHAYFDLYMAQEGLSIQRQALTNAELHLQRVENLFEQGLLSEYDKLRAELEVSRLYPEVINFENMANLAEENFKRLTGFVGNVVLAPALDVKTLAFADFEVSLEEALQSASDRRIELYLANLSVDIYQVQLSAERVNFLPNILLQADITRYNTSNSFDLNLGNDHFGTMGSVGIVFQMPLFTGLSNTSKALRSRHELRKSQYEAINATELINLEVRNSWQSFNQSLRHLEVQERNISLAQRALTIAQARFQNQTGIQLEVFDAQIQYNAAQIALSQAKIRIIKDFYALNKAMGHDLTYLIEGV